MVSDSVVGSRLKIQQANKKATKNGGNFAIAVRVAIIAPLPAKAPISASAAPKILIVFIWNPHVI